MVLAVQMGEMVWLEEMDIQIIRIRMEQEVMAVLALALAVALLVQAHPPMQDVVLQEPMGLVVEQVLIFSLVAAVAVVPAVVKKIEMVASAA